MVALNGDATIYADSHRLTLLALNLNRYSLAKCLWQNGDIEGCGLCVKLCARAAVECNLCSRLILKANVAAKLHVVIRTAALERGKLYSSILGMDIYIARNLLIVVASESNPAHFLPLARKLHAQPATYALQHKVAILARCNHDIALLAIAALFVALLGGE